MRFTRKFFFLLILSVLVGCGLRGQISPPQTCKEGQVQIMVLGVYHMGNPGRDVHNLEADDVLSPRRQREIKKLVERLAKWKPEAIAVEFPRDKAEGLNAFYREFLEGRRSYNRDTGDATSISVRGEVVQIGFRLAQKLGHRKILAVDWFPQYPDWITEKMLRDVMFYKPSLGPFKLKETLSEEQRKLRLLSISRYLFWLNSGQAIKLNDAMMISIALEYPDRKVAFAVASNWFERNLGIVRNLREELPKGVRKVLLIYGAGHVPMLRYILDLSPLFCPVSPLPYLKDR